MNAELPASQEVELLLFEIAGQRYGADASQVLRIERPGEQAIALSALGDLARGGRALVFRTDAGEGQLRVDKVQGVRPVQLDSLRRLPPAARATPFTIGIWLDGEMPVLLIDLIETMKSYGRQ